MRTTKRFSKEFKEAIVKKLISRGNKTIEQFCNENNLAISTVSRWQSECANVLEMKHKKDKSKYSAEKVLKIISETYSLNEEDLGRSSNVKSIFSYYSVGELRLSEIHERIYKV